MIREGILEPVRATAQDPRLTDSLYEWATIFNECEEKIVRISGDQEAPRAIAIRSPTELQTSRKRTTYQETPRAITIRSPDELQASRKRTYALAFSEDFPR